MDFVLPWLLIISAAFFFWVSILLGSAPIAKPNPDPREKGRVMFLNPPFNRNHQPSENAEVWMNKCMLSANVCLWECFRFRMPEVFGALMRLQFVETDTNRPATIGIVSAMPLDIPHHLEQNFNCLPTSVYRFNEWASINPFIFGWPSPPPKTDSLQIRCQASGMVAGAENSINPGIVASTSLTCMVCSNWFSENTHTHRQNQTVALCFKGDLRMVLGSQTLTEKL